MRRFTGCETNARLWLSVALNTQRSLIGSRQNKNICYAPRLWESSLESVVSCRLSWGCIAIGRQRAANWKLSDLFCAGSRRLEGCLWCCLWEIALVALSDDNLFGVWTRFGKQKDSADPVHSAVTRLPLNKSSTHSLVRHNLIVFSFDVLNVLTGLNVLNVVDVLHALMHERSKCTEHIKRVEREIA